MSDKPKVRLLMEVNKEDRDVVTTVTGELVSTALGYTPMDAALKGANLGVSELDDNGKVVASQLPSFVDDVIEGYLYNSKFFTDASHTKEIAGESGKIYVDLTTNKTYRWSGSAYTVISDTISLGETSSTAYRGDRGKIAYDHSQEAHAPSNAEKNQNAFSNVKIGNANISSGNSSDTLNIAAGKNVNVTADASSKTVTISATDTTYGNATDTASGLFSPEYKKMVDDVKNKYLPLSGGSMSSGASIKILSTSGGSAAVFNNNQLSFKTEYGKSTEWNKGVAIKNQSDSIVAAIGVHGTGDAPDHVVVGSNYTDDSTKWIKVDLTTGSTEISSTSWAPLKINNSRNMPPIIQFEGMGEARGGIGFSSKDGPIYRYNSSLDRGYIVLDAGNAFTTDTPKSNGTASAGSANTVSRSDHVHPLQTSVTGSSGSCTGNAATASALTTTSVGSATNPVYFDANGKPVKTTYTLGKSVPANANFENTWRGIQNNLTSTSTTDSLSAAQGKVLNDKFANYLPLTGGSVSGNVTFGGTVKIGTADYGVNFTQKNAGGFAVIAKYGNMDLNFGTTDSTGLNNLYAKNIYGSIANEQKVLYSSTGQTNITSASVTDLFVNNKLVIVYLTIGSDNTEGFLVPLERLKSSGGTLTTRGFNDKAIHFQYTDDNTLVWFNIRSQGALSFTGVSIVKIY